MRLSETHIAAATIELMKGGIATQPLSTALVQFLRRRRLLGRREAFFKVLTGKLDAAAGQLPVTIASARLLGAAEREGVEKIAQSFFPRKKLALNFRQQPELLGGFVIETENARYDASIARARQVFARTL